MIHQMNTKPFHAHGEEPRKPGCDSFLKIRLPETSDEHPLGDEPENHGDKNDNGELSQRSRTGCIGA